MVIVSRVSRPRITARRKSESQGPGDKAPVIIHDDRIEVKRVLDIKRSI